LNGNKGAVGATIAGSKETGRRTLSAILTVSRPSRTAGIERSIGADTSSDDTVTEGN